MRLLLTLLLVASTCLGSVDSLRRNALLLAPGAPIELKLRSKEKLVARLEAVHAEHITVSVLDTNAVSPRDIAFKDIKSIKEHDRCEGSKTWAATGKVIVALWVILGLLSLAIGG